MPFKSIQQERWGHTQEGMRALGGPAKVAEWDSASKGMKLPRTVGTKMGSRRPKTGMNVPRGGMRASPFARAMARMNGKTRTPTMRSAVGKIKAIDRNLPNRIIPR